MDHGFFEMGQFLIKHLALPLSILCFLALVLEVSCFDVWLAEHFYNAQLRQWPNREHWLAQQVIHKGGRYVVYGVGIIILLLWLWSLRVQSALNKYSYSLAYLLVSSLTGPGIVTYFKSHTHIYCPWDLSIFGGNKPYIRLFEEVSSALSVGHCFPSGHSVLGFTFVSLYFFFLMIKPKYKYVGLWFGLLLGFFFGFAQQIRGAHFFSHDVFSLAICWFSALAVFLIFFRDFQPKIE